MNNYFLENDVVDNKGNVLAHAGDLVVEDARLYYKNFSGKNSRYSSQGQNVRREFGVFVTDEMGTILSQNGWNVKYTRVNEEHPEYTATPYIPVVLKTLGPGIERSRIYQKADTMSSAILLSPESYDGLDKSFMTNINLIIHPWSRRDNPNMKQAQLVEMSETLSQPGHYDDVPYTGAGFFNA